MKLSDRLKLRHLEVFVEVARLRSVGRAAAALALTQPAVSRTLRELEAVVQKPLLERAGRGIRLTPFGEMLLPHAGAALAAARAGVETLSGLAQPDAPPVRLGALPTVSTTLIPEAVARFRAAGVLARLAVTTGENRVLFADLRDGALDLVVGRLPAPELMLGLTFEPLFRDRVTLVVAAGHPLAGAATLRPEDVLDYPMLMPGPGSIIRPFAERLFIEQGLPVPRDAIETVSDSFGRAFTAQHRAIWVISRGTGRPCSMNSRSAKGRMIEPGPGISIG
jgi:LysR family pca operon transcriptional activator